MFRFMVGMCITEDLTSHVVGFRVLGLGVLSLGLRCLGRASGLCHRREIPDIAKSLT